MKNGLKVIGLVLLTLIGLMGSLIGCKSTSNPLGHDGPFDVPSPTSTVTATPGVVNVYSSVVYQGTPQAGIGWTLVDPNGNTVGTATTNASNPQVQTVSFNPAVFGVYTANIAAQGIYGASTANVTVTAPGTYAANFACSNQTLSVSPNNWNYPSSVGNPYPVTVSYSETGNLNVPVSIVGTAPSAFNLSSNNFILNLSSTSQALTITKNACYTSTGSLSFLGYDKSANSISSATTSISLNRNWSIPVTVTVTQTLVSDTNDCLSWNSATYSVQIVDAGFGCGGYQWIYNPNASFSNITTSGTSYSGQVVSFSDSQICDQPSISPSIDFTFPDGSNHNFSFSSNSGTYQAVYSY